MNSVKVGNIVLGEGMPKICVPIVGRTREEILCQAEKIHAIPADIVEFRGDWYDQAEDGMKLQELLRELKKILAQLPLLFTFRTGEEGGERDVTPQIYGRICRQAIASKAIDLLDVEASREKSMVEELIEAAHKANIPVIGSNHDFEKTPSREEIISRLCHMQEAGMDILKIAVMPRSREDVLTLLGATQEMNCCHGRCPVVTMSMGSLGAVTRLCGEVFGSVMTFGSASRASAPGQVPVEDLNEVLDIIHRSLADATGGP